MHDWNDCAPIFGPLIIILVNDVSINAFDPTDPTDPSIDVRDAQFANALSPIS